MLARVPTVGSGIGYLFCFGVGTILGMVLSTSIMGGGFALLAFRERFSKGLRIAAGFASVAVGGMLFTKIAFIDGFLTG